MFVCTTNIHFLFRIAPNKEMNSYPTSLYTENRESRLILGFVFLFINENLGQCDL
jgi:hypothetical protein